MFADFLLLACLIQFDAEFKALAFLYYRLAEWLGFFDCLPLGIDLGFYGHTFVISDFAKT